MGWYSPTILKKMLCLFLQDFINLNATQLLIGLAEQNGLANQKLCYIQMLLNTEKSVKQDLKRSKEWLVKTDPEVFTKCENFKVVQVESIWR